jgi:RNA polymerase sigma-70 factor (ECF subfamily)
VPEGSIAGVTFSRAGSELTERELLEALRRKDSRGTRVFYDRYAGYLTAVALRYVPDRSAVKDILQESFLRIFDAVDRFEYRGEGSLRSWACRIVVNGALKSLRGQGKLQYVEDLPDVPEEEDVPVQQVPAAVLQRLIQDLPDGYRTVFNLYVFEKKSHREIAGLLGIKEDSSASQFFRARALLARQIKTYLKEHER